MIKTTISDGRNIETGNIVKVRLVINNRKH